MYRVHITVIWGLCRVDIGIISGHIIWVLRFKGLVSGYWLFSKAEGQVLGWFVRL